ncbi:MAG: 16S rRNA (guanine(966)-N(2))-methyltransferase RsmD [Betaproteobacteria bacterium]|nr:16S rRNA (guanine(966)-N(2))-methyltransferase RsmD [Betaproteobacteria bacterium]
MSRNSVRIIGGAWRSRLVSFPPSKELRPTPNRVRETLFNWLGQDLTGKACLDLFAGSGVLGFEAASRGAARVVIVERDREIFRALQASRERLAAGAVELKKADALEFLRADTGVYDVVFVDPPFKADCWARIAPLLARRLAPGALVYYECAAPPRLSSGWTAVKEGRAGQVRYHLLNWTPT